MASDTQQKSAELAARLDRLPFSKWHRNLFVLCFLGVMFDACDFALFGMALPPVAREFGLNPAQAGLLAAYVSGAVIGSGRVTSGSGNATIGQIDVGFAVVREMTLNGDGSYDVAMGVGENTVVFGAGDHRLVARKFGSGRDHHGQL